MHKRTTPPTFLGCFVRVSFITQFAVAYLREMGGSVAHRRSADAHVAIVRQSRRLARDRKEDSRRETLLQLNGISRCLPLEVWELRTFERELGDAHNASQRDDAGARRDCCVGA